MVRCRVSTVAQNSQTTHRLPLRCWPWEAGDFLVWEYLYQLKNICIVRPCKVSITDKNSTQHFVYSITKICLKGPDGIVPAGLHCVHCMQVCVCVCVCLYKLLSLHLPSESAACPRACVWCPVFTPVCVCVSVRLSPCPSVWAGVFALHDWTLRSVCFCECVGEIQRGRERAHACMSCFRLTAHRQSGHASAISGKKGRSRAIATLPSFITGDGNQNSPLPTHEHTLRWEEEEEEEEEEKGTQTERKELYLYIGEPRRWRKSKCAVKKIEMGKEQVKACGGGIWTLWLQHLQVSAGYTYTGIYLCCIKEIDFKNVLIWQTHSNPTHPSFYTA